MVLKGAIQLLCVLASVFRFPLQRSAAQSWMLFVYLYYILVFDLCAVVKWAFDDRGMLLILPLWSVWERDVPHAGLTNLLCCCIVRCAVM